MYNTSQLFQLLGIKMIFTLDDEDKRQLHPQVSLIPRALWHSADFFNSEISDDINLRVMSQPLIDVSHQQVLVKDLVSKDYMANPWGREHKEDKHQLTFWYCILLGHQEATDIELYDTAQKLNLAPNIIVTGAVYANRLDILYKFPNRERVEAMLADAFIIAAERGQLERLNGLKEIVGPGKLVAKLLFAAFGAAFGKKPVKDESTEKFNVMIVKAINVAAKSGHMAVLLLLNGMAPKTVLGAISEAVCYAVAGNTVKHIAILNWFNELDPEQIQQVIKLLNPVIFTRTIGTGIHVLKWLHNVAPDQIERILAKDVDSILYSAHKPKFGYEDVNMQFLLSFPICFAHAEKDEKEYGKFTRQFIEQNPSILQSSQQPALVKKLDAPFPAHNLPGLNQPASYQFFERRHAYDQHAFPMHSEASAGNVGSELSDMIAQLERSSRLFP